MYPKVSVNKYTAIIQLLRVVLATALSCNGKNQENASINQENIHLYKSRDLNRISYISGMALQNKKNKNLHSMKFAEEILLCLSANYAQELKVEIVSPGLIHIELTPVLLAAWLQHAVNGKVEYEIKTRNKNKKNKNKNNKNKNKTINSHTYLKKQYPNKEHLNPYLAKSRSSFLLQYVHARCCSLIQLAAREKLIELEESNAVDSASWVIVNPLTIPWLEDKQQLRLIHPAELRLISGLIKTIDDLECNVTHETTEWEKMALGLSQSFVSFWSNCRIWGEVKNTHRELAQARIGLIVLARLVFERLLEEKLGLIAPQEL